VSAAIWTKKHQSSSPPDVETTAAAAEFSTYLTPIIQNQVEADNHAVQPGIAIFFFIRYFQFPTSEAIARIFAQNTSANAVSCTLCLSGLCRHTARQLG